MLGPSTAQAGFARNILAIWRHRHSNSTPPVDRPPIGDVRSAGVGALIGDISGCVEGKNYLVNY